MYTIKNKFLTIIIVLDVLSINARNVPLLELSAGDIVNINDFEVLKAKTIGDIFGSNRAAVFTETEHFSDDHNYNTSVKKRKCLSLSSLLSYSYPEIIIDDTEHDPTKIFSSTDRLKYNYFGISQNYIHIKYLYGIVKICKVKRTQNLNIRMINGSDFPSINNRMNYKLLLDETAILRLKGNNGTHVVSSITTGDCLFQVYVNDARKCNLPNESQEKSFDDFFESSLYRSRVIIASNKRDLENIVNDGLLGSKRSLVDVSYNPKTYSSIFNLLDEHAVIRLMLHSLPGLPESPISSVHNPITYKTPLKYLKPGDVINIFDLKNLNSSITVDNMLVDVYDETTTRSTTLKYTDCFEYDVNDAPKLDYVPYKTYPNYVADSYYKFDLLDEMVKRKYYGIDRKYLNNNYKCMKITICSEFERRKSIIPSIRVITLDKQAVSYSNIFYNENIVLRYRINEETHYVARIEKGNCLFQALVFPNDGQNREYNTLNLSPLYTGKIISATGDPVFEKRAENFVRNLTVVHSNTLVDLINDSEAKASFFSQFAFNSHNVTLINIYLDDLY